LKILIVTVIAISLLWSCGKGSTPAAGQQATVTLNDGSTFSGTVTSSSASAISLQASTGESRTYPMAQVASVQYGQAAPVNQAAQSPVAAPAPAQSVTAPPQPVDEVRTIPAGTTLAVRNNDTIDSQTAEVGQTFSGVIEREVRDADGRVAIPRGASATLVV